MTLPRIAEGASRRNRRPADCPVTAAGFVLTGTDEAAVARKVDWVREHFAFLYSTPAYWPALDHLGFGDAGRKLHDLSKRSRWGDMKRLVTDEMIEVLVPQGRYADIAKILLDEYDSIVDQLTFPVPDNPSHDDQVSEILALLRREARPQSRDDRAVGH
jgi:alkanesulfonate monooxygenase SsuD/methylene tetrahydromethanopterin reductase-like flavin-dependent oxidoreductase (luciferase family)